MDRKLGNKPNREKKRDYWENRDYALWRLLEQTRMAIRKARKKEIEKYGVGPRKAVILALAYGTEGEVTPSQIARWLILEPHSISEAINRMEKDGLVKKVENPERKSSIKIQITEKGYEKYLKIAKQDFFHKLFSSITEQERQQLLPILKRLRDVARSQYGDYEEFPFPPY